MVAAAIIGSAVVGAVASTSAADSAADSQHDATQAASNSAAAQNKLATDQWDYQKNVILPKMMERDDKASANYDKLVQDSLDNSKYYRGVSEDALGQARKSYEFQDRYMQTARDYADGTAGNTEADKANADVHQAYGTGLQDLYRKAAMYGINPGSGAFQSALADMSQQESLASAGAQTSARRLYRDKAEQMVGIAAGAGQAGFGTGLNAGGLSTGAINAGTSAASGGVNSASTVSQTLANGARTSMAGYGGAASAWNSAANTPYNTGALGAISGLATGALKAGAAGGGGFNLGGAQASFSQTGLGSSGFGTGLAYGNQDYGEYLSDRRLKTEVERIGQTADGIGVYSFRYLWGGPKHVGVIAQEVENVKPWAVRRGFAGFRVVDYSKV